MRISQKDYDRIKHLKTLDIQQCTFCRKLNILNLGWKPFGKFYCRLHEEEYLVCWELCYKFCRNIWGCQLFSEVPPTELAAPLKIAVNQEYYRASCYLCSKELSGAGKHGTIKNRNNPSFWRIATELKILCLKCLGKKFYGKLSIEKRKVFNRYIKRGYE